MYSWKCPYCGEAISGQSPGEVNIDGRTHLTDHHRDELEPRFETELAGEPCRGDCGYQFRLETTEDQPFICPSCGHDNLEFYAGKLVWSELDRD